MTIAAMVVFSVFLVAVIVFALYASNHLEDDDLQKNNQKNNKHKHA